MDSMGFRKKWQRGNTVSGLLIGLLIGVIIAAAIALYVNFGPKPFIKAEKIEAEGSVPGERPNGNPISLPGKPGDKPVKNIQPQPGQSLIEDGQSKEQFDFYKLLPGGESASDPRPKVQGMLADKPSLQVGAYQNPSDADNLKARLALLGIEAKVQRVDLGEKGVFYRVRLGPFGNFEEADGMRARLANEGIETSLVKSSSFVGSSKH